MASPTKLTIQPDELSRRISEIDLTNLRRRADTVTDNPPRYTQAQLLELRPAKDDVHTPVDGLKTPMNLPPPPPPTPASRSHGSPVAGVEASTIEPAEPAVAPKKKKSKKSSGKNKKPTPTGFEEFYADPPITPDEHHEECDLYDPDRPFYQRIESCIQRYRKKRNLDSVRANILTKYFMLGGVESSSNKAFNGGLDEETLAESTAEEIAAIQATDYIRAGAKNAKYYDPTEPDKWVVDFEGVAKGFLSSTVMRRFALYEEKDVKQVASVIRNFLNYVLQHGVCPEYATDIIAARKICDLAEKELWAIKQLQYVFPGDFNTSASILYGGFYKGTPLNDSRVWETIPEELLAFDNRLGDADAELIFNAVIAMSGSDDLYLKVKKGDVKIVNTETKYYEVVAIERASVQAAESYSKILKMKGDPVKAIGNFQVKSWEDPGLDELDMTDDEDDSAPVEDSGLESFWLEDSILQHFFVGLKLELVVRELNIGVKFFDKISGIYCSYFTTLPNEKVIENWKEPSLSTRAPPTEDNPDAEENAMAADEDNELEDFDKDFGDKKIDVGISGANPTKT